MPNSGGMMMTWRPEADLQVPSGAAGARPVLISAGGPDVQLIAVTGDHQLAHLRFDGTAHRWAPAVLLPGPQARTSAPCAVSRLPGLVDLFAVGAGDHDGQVLTWWNATDQGRGWEGPTVLPGSRGQLSNAGLGAVVRQPYWLDVFGVSNPDGLFGPRALLHWWWDGRQWQGAESRGGRLLDITPAATSRVPGELDVFAIGADAQDGRVLTWWLNGDGWGGPVELPNQSSGLLGSGGVAAVSTQADKLDVFGVTRDGRLAHWRWDGGSGWRGPEFTPASPGLDPAGTPAVVAVPGRDAFELFATQAPDGILGPRRVLHWHAEAGVLAAPDRLLEWQSAHGPAAALDAHGHAFLASGRDDGQLAVSFTDPSYQPPGAPELTVEAVEVGYMRLSWTLPPGTVRTDIWSVSQVLLWDTTHKITSVQAPTAGYEERGLWPGDGRYCYFVVAFDAAGGGTPSNRACAQAGVPPVPPPTGSTGSMVHPLPTDIGVAPGGDLTITAASGENEYYSDTELTISWISENVGNLPAPAHHDQLTIYREVPGQQEQPFRPPDTLDVDALQPGQTFGQSVRVTLPPGSYRAFVELDSDNAVTETTRANNELSYGFEVYQRPKP